MIPIDRDAADRPFYSGKHKKHGMNLQVIATPTGEIVWVSGALPGSVHDTRAALIWGILRSLERSRLIVLADKGYHAAADHAERRIAGRTSPSHKRKPTAPTPSSAVPANAPTRLSRHGASCENSAVAPTAPDPWPRPSTYKPAKPTHDEKGSLSADRLLGVRRD